MPTKITTETFTVPGHFCEIVTDSQSCLPKVAPQAGCTSRLVRWIRKKLMVSRANPRTLMFFKSEAATKAEKRRQLRAPWYVIHPFSHFSVYREMVMCCVWMAMFIIEPLMISFFTETATDVLELHAILGIVEFCLLVNIFLCFILGYHVSKTKEVVLAPKKIVKHYLCTYFIVDAIKTIPVGALLSFLFTVDKAVVLMLTAASQTVGFLRLGTMLNYFRQITLHMRISDTGHELLGLVMMTMFIMHWLACAAYLIPTISYYVSGSLNPSSWTQHAQLPVNSSASNLTYLYEQSYLTALCHFLAAGHGQYRTSAVEEEALFSIMYIIGMAYIAYMIALVFEMVSCTRASESKYEDIVHQLNEYMRNKQLPHDLRKRLLLYYKHRFNMRYFRETAILSTLSEQQRSELFLYSCRELIENAKLFHGVPKTFIGSLMTHLKNEVYLTNDVIVRAGSRAESMFFIDKGTVAEVLTTGKEVRHLEDGEHFGEMPLVLEEARGKRIVNYVAVEVTECYRLEKKELLNCMAQHEQFAETLTKHARERYELLLQMEDDEDFVMNRKDVLYDLRSGKILEQPRRRMAFEKK